MKTVAMTLFLAAAILLTGCGEASSPNTTANNAKPTPAASPQAAVTPIDELARGRKLYMDNCAACHKENGTGGKIEIEGKSISPDDLTSAKIKAFDDAKISGYIYKGIEDEGMPAFKDKLSEAEIREVVRYVRAGIQKIPAAAEKAPSR